MKIKAPPLELIVWDDVVSHSSGWISPEEVKDLGTWRMYTAGYVVEENEKEIKVMSTYSDPTKTEISFGHDTIIPAGWIVSRKVLRRNWWK